MLRSFKSPEAKKALKAQIRLKKTILQQVVNDKTLYQFSEKGKDYSLDKLVRRSTTMSTLSSPSYFQVVTGLWDVSVEPFNWFKSELILFQERGNSSLHHKLIYYPERNIPNIY